MASSSSSSSSPRTWRYRVFTSFHGPDVRKTFLSHLRKQFNYNGISMFDDQEIERGKTIAPELTKAFRESRISLVVLSKNYASSSWCLDELVEIFKSKEDFGQIVMTIFCGVDPSDVRKQTGDFGIVFDETCACKSEEERRKWSQALTDASNIAGEHFLNWDNESKMIEKIAKDVSNKLNTTISKDFEDMVGIEAHLSKMQCLLHLEYEDEAMIVGICGPSGKIVMHKLLQQVGREAVQRQDHGKRQILTDTDEICDVLETDSGSRSVRGIYFDISTISTGVDISASALKKLRNLQFLSIYKTRRDLNVRVHIPEDMDFPPCLRICVVVSPKQQMVEYVDLLCRQSKNGFSTGEARLQILPKDLIQVR
ncbi:hypothetical protein AALP_AA5G111000 [Arabis alpina]|uniref:TIR domain-containing protein n=1 Tax=Arabis alpina TaxID=50452 RepID=A0A087GWC8_ARAAL|nr:hypothetical protein AALP_AA5G111000 [Arabis alpina]